MRDDGDRVFPGLAVVPPDIKSHTVAASAFEVKDLGGLFLVLFAYAISHEQPEEREQKHSHHTMIAMSPSSRILPWNKGSEDPSPDRCSENSSS
jgi:hypothetical protein